MPRHMSVKKTPGQTALTRTAGAYASAADFVSDSSAVLLAAYAGAFARPERPATEESVTMLPPPPPSVMTRAADWIVWKTPVRFKSMTRCHSTGDTSAIGLV